MKHIATLTGLRGVAALVVFISHSANESLLPAFLGNGFGQIGVMLFFVLSGFLMTHLYVHEDFHKDNIKLYIFARIGRVFPLYFLMLILSVVITQFISADSFYPFTFHEADKIIRALLLIDAKYVFWTIPVEVQFYVVFIAFWGLYKKGFNVYSLFAFVVITMMPSIILYNVMAELPKVVTTYSYAFFIGVITAFLVDKIKHHASIRKAANIFGLPSLVLLFINLPEFRVEYNIALFEHYFFKIWVDPVNWLIIYLLFICATLNSTSLSILNTRFFVFLGNISYGFYLIHYPVIMFFVREVDLDPLLKLVLAFVVAAGISYISYQYFEKRVGRKIRNFGKTARMT